MVSKELTGTFAYVYFMIMIAFVTMMKILMFFLLMLTLLNSFHTSVLPVYLDWNFKYSYIQQHFDGDVTDLALDFTVAEDICGKRIVTELKPGGTNISVTNENKLHYVHAMADYKLNRQVCLWLWYLGMLFYMPVITDTSLYRMYDADTPVCKCIL